MARNTQGASEPRRMPRIQIVHPGQAAAARGSAPDAKAGSRAGAATVTVTPEWSPQTAQAWEGWRRRLDAVRSATGRVTTVAGTAAGVGVVVDPGTAWGTAPATLALAAAGVGLLRLQMPFAGHQKATATVLYSMPGTALAALLAAGAVWGGAVVVELAVLAAWAAGVWLLRPARVARRMATPPPVEPEPQPAPVAPTGSTPAAAWWAGHAAVVKGPAEGTVLEDVERVGDSALRAVIRSTVPGAPVPDIPIKKLSALMDVPEDQISIGPVPGRGAGVRLLTIGTPDAAAVSDPVAIWNEQIAPLAMPGMKLVGIRVGRPGGGQPVDLLKKEET